MDAVLAASVAPFEAPSGDHGILPLSPPPYGTVPLTSISISGSPPPSLSNYQAPGGETTTTTDNTTTMTPNYSIRDVTSK